MGRGSRGVCRPADTMNKRYPTIHMIMTRLREAGYISVYRDSTAGPGAPSSIRVWWYEDSDKMREMVRENPNNLPAVFQKVITDADMA